MTSSIHSPASAGSEGHRHIAHGALQEDGTPCGGAAGKPYPAATPSQWTPERDATLRSLRLDGLSFSEIGKRLGTTKGACIGRAHRLGLKAPARVGGRKHGASGAHMREDHRNRSSSHPAGASPHDNAPAGSRWTADDDLTLRNMYAAYATDFEIAKALKRSEHAVLCRRVRLGLVNARPKKKAFAPKLHRPPVIRGWRAELIAWKGNETKGYSEPSGVSLPDLNGWMERTDAVLSRIDARL